MLTMCRCCHFSSVLSQRFCLNTQSDWIYWVWSYRIVCSLFSLIHFISCIVADIMHLLRSVSVCISVTKSVSSTYFYTCWALSVIWVWTVFCRPHLRPSFWHLFPNLFCISSMLQSKHMDVSLKSVSFSFVFVLTNSVCSNFLSCNTPLK